MHRNFGQGGGSFGNINNHSAGNNNSDPNPFRRISDEEQDQSFSVDPNFYARANGQWARNNNSNREQTEQNHSGGPSAQPNASAEGYQPHNQRREKRARQKYVPPTKTDLELFDEDVHIQQGGFFDMQYGMEKENEIVVSSSTGVSFGNRICTFEECGFSEAIMNNIKLRKYQTPTPIQRAVIPLIQTKRNDIIGHAQTGSGKTAAFLLPIIDELQSTLALNKRNNVPDTFQSSPFCIVLVPTKELAQQLFDEALSFATGTGVKMARTYGDLAMKYTREQLKMGCHILFTTSGRLKHHIGDKDIKLTHLRYFILDEADRLITDNQFMESVNLVITSTQDRDRLRLLLFSATFNQDVQLVIQQFLKSDYIFARVGRMNQAVDTTKQEFLLVRKMDKQNKLMELLKENAERKYLPDGKRYLLPEKKTIIFVEEKRQSDKVAMSLVNDFCPMSINGDRSLKQRMEAFEKFKKGVYHILVATDVAARGLNMPNVGRVINYDLPVDDNHEETYIHRIGRTGRAGNVGEAISFFDPFDPANLDKVDYYIKILEESKQKVPEFLQALATKNQAANQSQSNGGNQNQRRHRTEPKESEWGAPQFFDHEQSQEQQQFESASQSAAAGLNRGGPAQHRSRSPASESSWTSAVSNQQAPSTVNTIDWNEEASSNSTLTSISNRIQNGLNIRKTHTSTTSTGSGPIMGSQYQQRENPKGLNANNMYRHYLPSQPKRSAKPPPDDAW